MQRSRNAIKQLRSKTVSGIGMVHLHGSHRGIVEHARRKLGRPERTRTGGRVKRNHLHGTTYTEKTGVGKGMPYENGRLSQRRVNRRQA